jgi:nitrite reductase/ring-hydroxylating ferredoxin subunit
MAAPSGVLRRTPLAVTVDGTELVLFRDRQGRPAAMPDRCPHRGLPLSMGECRKGRLVCHYHGWEFDHEGVCQRIPSDLKATKPRPMIAPQATCEQDGYVWVMTSALPDAAGMPEALPLADRRWWQTRVTVPHPFLAVAGQLAVLAHAPAAAGGCQWTETLPSGRQARVLVWPVPVDDGQTRLEVCVERHGGWPFGGRTAYRADLPLPLGLQALRVSDTYSGPAAVESP